MKFSNFKKWITNLKNLWIVIFLYTIILGLLVQLILLPYVFPNIHAGQGLLIGMDGMKFHRIALRVVENINQNGWRAWELTPQGQLVSGIASIFYKLIYPAPWSVLPLNGFLNATACICVFILFSDILQEKFKGLIAALPFIFFPSNLLWNTQFHNENYAVPGFIFMLTGWYFIVHQLIKLETKKFLKISFLLLIGITIGSAFIGLIRIYILKGLILLFSISPTITTIFWLITTIKNKEYLVFIQKITLPLLAFVSMFLIYSIINNNNSFQYEQNQAALPGENYKTNTKFRDQFKRTSWMPDLVENQIIEIANYRNKFVNSWADSGSIIDQGITFKSTKEFFMYLPRASIIGFFSPFPDLWFTHGKKEAGSLMRALSPFEMLLIYIFYIGLPIFFWKNRKNISVWMILIVCFAMVIVYAITIPNIGALYRFRYPYLMPIVCLGLAGWLSSLSFLKSSIQKWKKT